MADRVTERVGPRSVNERQDSGRDPAGRVSDDLVGATDADGDLEESSARAHLRAKESPTCSAAHLAPNDEILPPRERAPRAKQHMLARTEPRAIVALGSLFVRCGCMHEFYRGEG